MTNDDDTVLLMAKIAFKNFKEGHLSKAELMKVLQRCINIRALENGYADRFGMPFPRVQ
jgi:hypothetical protein